MKMEHKKDSGLSWLAFWKIDKEDVKRQAENYASLKFTNSSKGLASLLLIGSIILSFILSFVGWVPLQNVTISAAIYLPIIFFIYKGNRLAIIVMMIAWTVERTFSIVTSVSNNFYYSSVLIGVSWWAIVTNLLFEAFRVEQLRRKMDQRTENTNSSNQFRKEGIRSQTHYKSTLFKLFMAISTVILLGFLIGGSLYFFQMRSKNNESASVHKNNEDYFSKKIECANQTDRIKRDIALEQEKIDPAAEMFIVNFQTIFYSPKTNSCLYVETTRFRSKPIGEGLEPISKNDFEITVYDALTKQKIKSFKTSAWTFAQNKADDYNQFLTEYQN